MALHTDTEIYKATYALCQLVTQLVAGMPRNYKADFGADLRWPLLTKTARSAIPSSACSYQFNSFLNHSNRRFFP